MADKILVIMRGLPGSGKSTLAKSLLKDTGEIFSTDDYWNDEQPFNPSLLGKAHAWNEWRSEQAMLKDVRQIIIDNTNISIRDFKGYILLAKKYGYQVIFKEPETMWKNDLDSLVKKTIHGVPKSTIEKMSKRWQPTDKIIKDLKEQGLL